MKNKNQYKSPYVSHHVPINSGAKFNRHPDKKHDLKLLAATAATSLILGAASVPVIGSAIHNHIKHDEAVAASLEQVGGEVTIEPGETVYGVAQGIADKENKDPRDVAYDIAVVNPGVNIGAVEAGQPINIPKPEVKDVPAAYHVLPAEQSNHQANQ